MSQSFLNKRLQERPGLAEALDANAEKRESAMFLRALRKAAGLTQAELAAQVGWKQSYVSRLERVVGAVPEDATIARYAEGCGFALQRQYRAEPVAGGAAAAAGAKAIEVAL